MPNLDLLMKLIPAALKYGPLIVQLAREIHESPLVQALVKDKGMEPGQAAEKALSLLVKPADALDADDHSLLAQLLDRVQARVGGVGVGGAPPASSG